MTATVCLCSNEDTTNKQGLEEWPKVVTRRVLYRRLVLSYMRVHAVYVV